MGRLIRAYDWDASPIGAPRDWPQVLHVLIDLMLSSSQPMFIVWGPERTLLYNDAYSEILAGKHPCLGMAFEEVWREIWEQDLKPIVRRAYAGEALHMADIPLRMMRKGYPEETHFSFSYTPVRDADDTVQGFLCPCLEITEQVLEERRAQLRVQLTEILGAGRDPSSIGLDVAELLARHLGVAQGAYGEIDEAGEFAEIRRDWNDGSLQSCAGRHRLRDFGPEFIADLKKGRSIVISDVGKDRRTSSPAALETFAKRGIRAFLNIPHLRNGKLVAVMAVHSAHPTVWHPSDVALVKEVAQRVHTALEAAQAETARRASEQSLRETRDALALATKASSLGWATWDFAAGTANIDSCGAEILGFETGDIEIADWMQRVHPEDQAHFEREIRDCLRAGRPFDLEYRFMRPDGSLRHLHATGVFETDADGAPILGSGFVRDITERKHSEKRQALLMAELDHRVKNILAVVQSIARQSLARGHGDKKEAAERLVGRISALAQSHSLLARSRWQGADFEVLVENALAPHRGEGSDRCRVDGPALKVTPKAAQTLTLALHELVTNAAKYGALSGEDGVVTVKWQLTETRDGRRLIFDWRESGGPSIEAPPSRTGFGAILIENMLAADLGGAVTLDYAREGLHAHIDLPLENLRADDMQSEHPLTPVAASAGGRPRLSGKRVLVVEDEHLVAQETVGALQTAGCPVVGPAGNMANALRMASNESFDVAILDVNLNGDLVWPVARVLRSRGIPFVFATGYSKIIDMPDELADATWIEKPFDPDQLVQSLGAALARAAVD